MPTLFRQLVTIQTGRTTRSSIAIFLQRPTNPSQLKISDRSFHYFAPVLWNNLSQHLRAFSPHYIAQTSEQPLLLSQSQFFLNSKPISSSNLTHPKYKFSGLITWQL